MVSCFQSIKKSLAKFLKAISIFLHPFIAIVDIVADFYYIMTQNFPNWWVEYSLAIILALPLFVIYLGVLWELTERKGEISRKLIIWIIFGPILTIFFPFFPIIDHYVEIPYEYSNKFNIIIVFEAVYESIPQLLLQCYNNDLNREWNSTSILTFFMSLLSVSYSFYSLPYRERKVSIKKGQDEYTEEINEIINKKCRIELGKSSDIELVNIGEGKKEKIIAEELLNAIQYETRNFFHVSPNKEKNSNLPSSIKNAIRVETIKFYKKKSKKRGNIKRMYSNQFNFLLTIWLMFEIFVFSAIMFISIAMVYHLIATHGDIYYLLGTLIFIFFYIFWTAVGPLNSESFYLFRYRILRLWLGNHHEVFLYIYLNEKEPFLKKNKGGDSEKGLLVVFILIVLLDFRIIYELVKKYGKGTDPNIDQAIYDNLPGYISVNFFIWITCIAASIQLIRACYAFHSFIYKREKKVRIENESVQEEMIK